MKLINPLLKGALSCLCAGTLLFSCNDKAELASMDDQLNNSEQVIPGKYIVMLKEDGNFSPSRLAEPDFGANRQAKNAYSSQKRETLARKVTEIARNSGVSDDKISHVYTSVIVGFAAELSDDQLSVLKANKNVLSIEADTQLSINQSEIVKGGDVAASQRSSCAATNAGGSADGSSSDAWIWIVDTGIDLDHPDLNVVTNSKYAKSFVGGSADDCQGHGSHVAGIAAAKNNSFGAVGVSAGAAVVPVRVLGCDGIGAVSGIIAGMDHVAANDIAGDVVNMSLGPKYRTGCSSSSSYLAALNRLNDQSWIALAAGNSADDASYYDPGCHNLSRVYTIASMTCGKGWSSFSNYGSPVDYIATGSDVYSTYKDGRYATLSGTSMASPVIAGVLHQRNSAPRSCGSVSYGGRTYSIGCR